MHCVPFDMRLVSSFHSEKCYYICEISYFLLFFLNTYSRTWWPIFPTLHVPLYIYHSVYSEMDKEPQFHTSCPLSHSFLLAGNLNLPPCSQCTTLVFNPTVHQNHSGVGLGMHLKKKCVKSQLYHVLTM